LVLLTEKDRGKDAGKDGEKSKKDKKRGKGEGSDKTSDERSTPPSAEQRWLEAELRSKGWLYTVVHDEKSFLRELRTGTYSVYGVFGGSLNKR